MKEQEDLFHIPFLKEMKKTIASLENGKFEVKKDSSGDYSIYFKRVIIVGHLPREQYAKSIAEELNVFIRRRKKIIELALQKAETMVYGACSDVADAITGGSKERQSDSVESDSGQYVESDRDIRREIFDSAARQSEVAVQSACNKIHFADDENEVSVDDK